MFHLIHNSSLLQGLYLCRAELQGIIQQWRRTKEADTLEQQRAYIAEKEAAARQKARRASAEQQERRMLAKEYQSRKVCSTPFERIAKGGSCDKIDAKYFPAYAHHHQARVAFRYERG